MSRLLTLLSRILHIILWSTYPGTNLMISSVRSLGSKVFSCSRYYVRTGTKLLQLGAWLVDNFQNILLHSLRLGFLRSQ